MISSIQFIPPLPPENAKVDGSPTVLGIIIGFGLSTVFWLVIGFLIYLFL